MKSPNTLLASISFLLMGLIGPQNLEASASSPTDHTNFVIILADDLGYGDLGCYGGARGYQTPEIDRMAAEGVLLTDFYAPDSICTPSRAGLLTGRLAERMATDMKVFFPWSLTGMPEEEVTIAEMLKTKGYATAMIGKWHLGHLPQFLPTEQGFDLFWGIPYSNDMSQDGGVPAADDVRFFEGMTLEDYQSYRPSAKMEEDPDYRGFRDPKYRVFRNKVPLMSGTEVTEWPVDQAELTRRYTEKAVEFIEANADRPFFFVLAHTMPHIPLFVSEKFSGESERGLYGDVIEEMDWSVGRVLETLRSYGLDENTLVVFTSDNGPWKSMGENGGSAGPFRDGKGSSYEGGFRVPGIFWLPGSIPAGKTSAFISSQLDLLPTFAAISGAEIPDRPLDGVNISQALAGNKNDLPEVFVYNNRNVIRMGNWKYRKGLTHGIWSGYPRDFENPEVEQLFNLEDDPGEQVNLIEQYPEKTDALKSYLNQFRTQAFDQ
ncbi:MAG: sulfatase [Verrucomicrobiota bacterium]